MTETQIISGLSSARQAAALDLIGYMLDDGLRQDDADVVLAGMSERIRAAGVPLDRATSIVPLLHAEAVASARFWERGKGTRSYAFSANTGEAYANSPVAYVHQTGEWLVLWLPDTPDSAYDIVSDLKAEGMVHYVMMPVFMKSGMANTFSFATRDKGGFSDADFAFLRAIFPAISACQEILATHRMMSEAMRMYVGREPSARILRGDVHRGEVMRMQAAILFADMRRFTELPSQMDAEAATALLNAYHDCVVPAVEAAGGEVLKFIGDGIPATFRAEGAGEATCVCALGAARATLSAVASQAVFEVGIGLHFGEVAYGNVGSGVRLDYTVIGRDVNLAARVAGLCGTLGASFLMSGALCNLAGATGAVGLGRHALKGLAEPQAVFSI